MWNSSARPGTRGLLDLLLTWLIFGGVCGGLVYYSTRCQCCTGQPEAKPAQVSPIKRGPKLPEIERTLGPFQVR